MVFSKASKIILLSVDLNMHVVCLEGLIYAMALSQVLGNLVVNGSLSLQLTGSYKKEKERNKLNGVQIH